MKFCLRQDSRIDYNNVSYCVFFQLEIKLNISIKKVFDWQPFYSRVFPPVL